MRFLARNLRGKSEECKDYTLQVRLPQVLQPVARAISLRGVGCITQCKQKSPWKKHQNRRERPHFFGFQPPKKFVGSLPPCGTVNRAGCFFHPDKEFGETQTNSGDDPEVVIQRIADYRADAKDDPNYYARHIVRKAQAALDSAAKKAPDDLRSKSEEIRVAHEH